MTFIDITLNIDPNLATWQNEEPGVQIEWVAQFVDGASECCVSSVSMGSHLGTHIDAPLHFIRGGGSIEGLALETLIGPCVTADLTAFDGLEVPAELLESLCIPKNCKRLLLKSSNSVKRLLHDPVFHSEFVGLSPESAVWIRERGIKLVGFDYLSAASPAAGNVVKVHQLLLGGGVLIVEGLDLCDVEPGEYKLICLPLKTVGAEASPVRAVLEKTVDSSKS